MLLQCIVSSFFFLLLCCWFHREVTTTFYYQPTSFNSWLHKHLVEKVGHYSPPWWYNMHLGSLVPFGKSPALTFCRENFVHEDETTFSVDWYPCSPPLSLEKELLVTLFFPGLGLNSDANVAQVFAKTITAERSGRICGIINPRTYSSKPWHAALTDDAKLVLRQLAKARGEKKTKVFLAGFSASSNIVAMTISDLPSSKEWSSLQIIGALCVCVNYDYLSTRTLLEDSVLGRMYSRLLVLQFKQLLNTNKEKIDPSLFQTLHQTTLLSEYDRVACRWYGFESEEEMYRRLSPKHILHKIDIPFVAIQPADDPLYLYSHGRVEHGIDLKHYVSNPNVFFMQPSHGNHFGFYLGPLLEAFSNQESYTFPAKVAATFIECLESTNTE